MGKACQFGYIMSTAFLKYKGMLLLNIAHVEGQGSKSTA